MLVAIAPAPLRRGGGVVAAALAVVLAASSAPHAARAAETAGPPAAAGAAVVKVPEGGAAIYREACAVCHGADGSGATRELVGFQVFLPNFTDCNFATRELVTDWVAIVHDGGPARGFERMMPAFGDALDMRSIREVVGYLRTLCPDRSWPRGELNLPRAMFTEKAFPEDEAVLTTGIALEGPGEVANELVYERRFGALTQGEILVPFTFEAGRGSASSRGGIGDIALGVKRALVQSSRTGSIFSAALEARLPTGDASRGFGKGTTIFEGYLAFGQLVPRLGFVQLQAGAEQPLDTEKSEREGFARAAIGRTLRAGGWGRGFTPMLEVVATSELSSSAVPTLDLVPQMQVTLSTRQHVMASAALLLPVRGGGDRPKQLYLYVLWDWFDGGLFDGW